MRPFAKALPIILRNHFTIAATVTFATVFFGLFEFAVFRWSIDVRLDPDLHAALNAAIVGLGTGLSLLVILLGILERRDMAADQLRRVEQLNHNIRNALELIVLANESQLNDEMRMVVLESTKRIDQTLRQLFPFRM
jgi:hypothetical protein